MTAHWGVEDPAAFVGPEDKRARLFRAVYGMLENRIKIFSSCRSARSTGCPCRAGCRRSAGCAKAPRSRKKPEPGTTFDLRRQLIAEALGTAFLLAAVVGSGIMAERLAGGSVGLALLVQHDADRRDPGRHHPDVRAGLGRALQSRRDLRLPAAARDRAGRGRAFVGAQIAGGLAGTWLAHLMFDEPVLMLSAKLRTGTGQWVGEIVATFGLVATILACLRFRKEAIPSRSASTSPRPTGSPARPRSPIRR